ncbi:DUF4328 domain-containing protein [Streptomyces sp. MUSC 125]|uniref:DUF4328 domain-containing protein n=1 Tax=Streptomyces sp. MUSC 125 TaxID=1428624 RepID=UPI000A59D712
MTEQMDQPIAYPFGLRPIRLSGQLAAGALLLAGLVWVVRGVWEIRLALAGEPASGPPVQGNGVHRPLNALEDSYHFVNAAGSVGGLLCAVFFIGWLWRVRDNAKALSGQAPKYAGFWVYAGWCVPIVNLWIPRGIVADVFHASAPGRKLPASLNVWWALWLIGMLSGVGFVYRDSTDEIIARTYTGVGPLLVFDAAVVGSAVAGALVVRALTRVQLERMRGVLPEGDKGGHVVAPSPGVS